MPLNYPKRYYKSVKRELLSAFKNYAYKPKYIVAEDGGNVVGFAGYINSWMDYHIYQIFWVNVHPKFQGRGIGTALMKRAIKEIKKNKGDAKPYAILLIDTSKHPPFYRRLGFERVMGVKKTGKDRYDLLSFDAAK